MPDAAPSAPATGRSPTLYLIDGYAQFFRAYHAIRTPMSSPVTKEPTNMSFGFLGMLLKLLRGEGALGGPPDYVALTLDVSGDRGTFRTQLYPEYKATRDDPPEDLEPQVQRCLKTMEAMGIPILGAAGFEADDVIATLVKDLRSRHPELRIRIISKDKDLKQLLANDHVELYDVHHEAIIDQRALKEETGLEPKQVIDYLALMGDNVDNVPGVVGIGPKTAAQLIVEYGSLEGVLAEAAKENSAIKGKRLENIRAAVPHLPLSRELVTLRDDAPVTLELEAARAEKIRLSELMPVLKELGFNRYQDELRTLMGQPAVMPPPAPVSETPKPAAPPSKKSATASSGDLWGGGGGGLFDQVEVKGPSTVRVQSGVYRCITSPKELRELVEELREAEVISIDTETTGLPALRHELAGVCLSTKIGTGVYVPTRSPTPSDHMDQQAVLGMLRPILEDPTRPKCGHNLKFDMLVFRRAGVKLAGCCVPADRLGTPAPANLPWDSDTGVISTIFDSMVASYLIDAERSSHGLDALALALLGRTNVSITELIGTGKDQRRFDQVPLDAATQYAAEDADVALQLRAIMLPQIEAMALRPLFERVEMPLVEVLAELEWNGIRVDKAELELQRARLQQRIDTLRREIVGAAEDALGRPFNPDSPKQLAGVLFNKPSDAAEPGLGLKPIKRIKTGYSTDAEVLDKLAEDPTITTPIPKLIVEHRELSKLVNTYLEALVDDIYPEVPAAPEHLRGLAGRIHCSFNQTVAATGRLASSDPNLQNIPIRTDVGREIRRAFVAPPGCVLISADYSQIELRLLAHLSRDPALIQAFQDDQDIHTAVAAQIHGVPLDKVTREQRSGAKMVNFGIVYGITAFGLARRLGVSNTQADEIITGYKKRFAGITTFLQECIDQATRFGYVQTMLGRRRPITDIHSTNPSRRAFAERTAINSVVQGSAADLIKLAMVDLHAATHGTLPTGVRMLLQIHDELVFETPAASADAACEIIKSSMEGAMTLSVPLKVEVGTGVNWFEGK
ncbi:MAG: DNA polymerase I [Phycisphaerales bacterium]|nr:DNA polymerase I [Phycisphaerales bacterium]